MSRLFIVLVLVLNGCGACKNYNNTQDADMVLKTEQQNNNKYKLQELEGN